MHKMLPDNTDAAASKPMAQRRCSMCDKSFVPSVAAFLPFCSQRCQQLDLRLWLNESYGLPWDDPDKADQPESDQEE